MAMYQNDPFPGTDYGSYQSWQKITTPDGQTYYVVPGNEGYVFDPVASNASGRKVFRRNPKTVIDAQAEEKAQHDAAVKQQMFNQSPGGQLIPVAGTVGGLYAAHKFLGPATAAAETPAVTTPIVNAAVNGAVANGATAGLDGVAGAASGAGDLGATAGSAVAPETSTLGAIAPYAGIAGAGLGAYGIYNAMNMNDKKKAGMMGAMSGLGLGGGLAAASPLLLGTGPVGWGVLGASMLGGALLGGGLGAGFAHKTTGEIQNERWANAAANGANPELAAKMQGYDYFTGTGGMTSRDEKYLTPDAIRVNPDNYNNVPDWDKWSKTEQDEFLSDLLAKGKVREKKGGIYYDDDYAKAKADEIRAARTAPKTGPKGEILLDPKATPPPRNPTPMPRGGGYRK